MKDHLYINSTDVEVSGAPETISILPLGHVISSKGEFDVDAESYNTMLKQIAQRGVDVVIDYEHQTLKGVQAPAAGWVKELILRNDCIAARVEWTPAAKAYLENKEYRYLSPVISARKSDGKAIGLHSLALTNTPAIEGMTPIVNSLNYEDPEGGTNNMDIIKKIAQLLGLAEDATEDQVFEALGKALNEAQALKDAAAASGGGDDKIVANKAVCELLDLKAGAPADEIAAKIMALKGGNLNGVNVIEELNNLKQKNANRDADDAVTIALKSGKITPAQKDWAKSYALSDPKGFSSFVEKAPQVVPMGEIDLEDTKSLKDDQLEESTLIACKLLGVSNEDLEKFGKEC